MSAPATTIELAQKLADALATCTLLYGDEWPTVSQSFREVITAAMQEKSTDSPIAAALPIATELGDKGYNPLVLLATAADMAADGEGMVTA